MRLTRKDVVASVAVLAVVVPFVGYAIRGSMPFLEDSRGMAGVALAGAFVMGLALGRESFGNGVAALVAAALGAVTLGFGLAALADETAPWTLLAPAVVALVVLWAIAMLHDSGHLAR